MINRLIARIIPLLPKQFIWIFSKKYIAGETVGEALKVVKELNSKKMLATIDILGESVDRREQAELYQKLYIETIECVIQSGLKASFSLKPTMFGLLWDYDYCHQLIRQIVEKVNKQVYFVRIDMEDSQCTQLELDLFASLYKEFGSEVGIVLQACLKRTIADISFLAGINSKVNPVNIRICKGIYNESRAIAFKTREEIRGNYLACLDSMLANGLFPAIATHDKKLIDKCLELLSKYRKTNKDYEFQMLYGVTPLLRNQLVEAGHLLRVYVPFGEQWLRYSTRRLQENPRMVRDIILALFLRK
jgi:proline dehydrogenase